MPRATVELVTSTLPALRLACDGNAYNNPKPMAALIHRIAAWLEEQTTGRAWVVEADTRNAEIRIDVLPPTEKERRDAMALLERAAKKVNEKG
jgi:hypothetical protein